MLGLRIGLDIEVLSRKGEREGYRETELGRWPLRFEEWSRGPGFRLPGFHLSLTVAFTSPSTTELDIFKAQLDFFNFNFKFCFYVFLFRDESLPTTRAKQINSSGKETRLSFLDYPFWLGWSHLQCRSACATTPILITRRRAVFSRFLFPRGLGQGFETPLVNAMIAKNEIQNSAARETMFPFLVFFVSFRDAESIILR